MRKVSGKEKESTLTAQKEAPQPMKDAVKGFATKETEAKRQKAADEDEQAPAPGGEAVRKGTAAVGAATALTGAVLFAAGLFFSTAVAAVGALLTIGGAGLMVFSDYIGKAFGGNKEKPAGLE